MGISTQRVKLDISKQASMQVLRLGQGDRNGTTLVAELYDGGSPYSLSGKTARFTMRTPDRQSSYSVASSSTSGNTATFNIDERYAAGVAGTTDVAYIEVMSGSTIICSTSRMRVICLQSATEGVSPSQMHDNGLDAAIAAANTAASSANTAASNANTKASRAETATTNANTARDNANTAASAANTEASAATTAAGSANTAAEAANSAKDAANAAATAATTAAGNANAATSEANAAIEAMGDISELAVPEMTSSVRGGAKVGGSTQVVGGKLEVKLSESVTGTSVTTGSTSALRELQVHGKSVQNGTPTPDAPVEVQVVDGANLLNVDASSTTNAGITYTVNVDGTFSANGTATGESRMHLILDENMRIALGDEIKRGTLTLSVDSPLPANTRLEIAYYNGGTYADSRTYVGSSSNYVVVTSPQVTFDRVRIYFLASSGVTLSNLTIRPMLVHGSTATPYVPYGSIGIVVGDTATPIDLQGNTLASLPDGTRDELHVDSTGHVWIEKSIEKFTFDGNTTISGVGQSENGKYSFYTATVINMPNTPPAATGDNLRGYHGWCTHYQVNTDYAASGMVAPFVTLFAWAFSHTTRVVFFDNDHATSAEDFAAFLTDNPVTVYYPGLEKQTIDLGYIDPPAIPSGSVVTISASLTPTFDLACWTEHASELADITDAITTLAGMVIGDEQESIASSIAPVEDSTASANHAVGDYLMLGARLYRVTTAIASGERITPGTNVTGTTVMSEIVSLLS